MSTVRLVVADDHPVVRAGIVGMLAANSDFEIVGEAGTGKEAVTLSQQELPDVVLMDLRMPEMDGVAAIEQIRSTHPDIHVLVLTTYDTDADILRAIDAGATGYLLKDTPREELFVAILAASRGEAVLGPTIATRLMERVSSTAPDALSAREIEVLELVARGASNKEIAASLYISVATAKSHLMHIYDKLGVTDRTAAVTTAIEQGVIRLD